ncbi:hypothetical protein NT239_08835 [Chitinibacter sp. SCUT-21]|uniref:hypothetical protein n=1 Tax=Chitinibacter sp. SCUT-21 TaxID=2970891 RepID=UPI0035A6726B
MCKAPFTFVFALLAQLLSLGLVLHVNAQAQVSNRFTEVDQSSELRVKKGRNFNIQMLVAPAMAQSYTLKSGHRKVKFLTSAMDYRNPADKNNLYLGCCLMVQTWTFKAIERGVDTIVLLENHQDRISEHRYIVRIE